MKKTKHKAPTDCMICGFHEERPWHFSKHVLSKHGLTAQQYTIKYLRGGNEPNCLECGARTRYCTFAFKDYCKEHSYIAEAKGGAKGGKAPAWNKGLTVETDERIKQHVFFGQENPFFGKKHTEEAKKSNADKHRLPEEEFNKRVNLRSTKFKCLSTYADYKYRQGQKLLFQCVDCLNAGRDTIIQHTLFNFERNPICKVCHPGGSKEQLDIASFINTFGFNVIYNDREVIGPKELDIYVPEAKLAIEYNSFYYHSHCAEDARKERHLEKTVMAQWAGTNLIHVFQDEWLNKQSIVKSMITYRLKKISTRIYARDCELVDVSSAEANRFFDANHIAGYCKADIARIGLQYNGVLVSLASFRKPFHKKRYEGVVEMARFASSCDVVVIGGLSKIIARAKVLCKEMGYKGIITYADLRYGKGSSYLQAGFEDVGWTGLSYDYNDGANRFSRFKFRAHGGLTEKQVAEAAGVKKIYGCGSMKYLMMF
jgi:hypothetical protein